MTVLIIPLLILCSACYVTSNLSRPDADTGSEEWQEELDAPEPVDHDAREDHGGSDDGADGEETGSLCGDGLVGEGEECDDGNTTPGDGCESDCTYSCHNDTECTDADDCTDDFCDPLTHQCAHGPSAPHTPCDDGVYCTYPDECDGMGACSGIPVHELYGVTAVEAGTSHTCTVLGTGGVQCWGDNEHGQIGDGSTTDRTSPVDVSGLSSGVTAVSAGESHTCALLEAGGVQCWGNNEDGQLGDGTTTDRTSPVDVSGLSSGVIAVSAGGSSGSSHTCALLDTGGVQCWGGNWAGMLGDGSRDDSSTPVHVSGLSSGVTAIAAGGSHACALLGTGGVKCWGSNMSGQIGDGSPHSRTRPV
ncbi:MAG: DUF4215 domain-containing protein, partial [Pseudomonadota bacterium]